MKLTELLKEASEEEKFRQLIKSGQFYGTGQQRFYRGSRGSKSRARGIETFKRLEVRKDRRPLHTPWNVDALIEGVRQAIAPKAPNRRKSVFVTPDESVASNYGTVHYVLFPKKSNIWHSGHDALAIFDQMGMGYFPTKVPEDPSKSPALMGFPPVRKLLIEMEMLVDLNDAMYNERLDVVEKLAAQHYQFMKKNAGAWKAQLESFKTMISDKAVLEIVEDARHAAGLFLHDVPLIEKYYGALKPFKGGRVPNAYEFIVEADHFYMVNKEWYDENIGRI